MDSTYEHSSQLYAFARQILAAFSLDSIPTIFELFRSLQEILGQGAHEGLYEMVEYDAQVELVDSRGERAHLEKRLRVKFLQDNVIAFQDHAWGNGEVLADYRCSPGVEVDRYQDGDRWNILISLRETKSSGDVEDFYIERMLTDSFTKDAEWWQVEMQNSTKWLKLSIVFPKDRPCQRATICEKMHAKTTALGPDHFSTLPDGRQMLSWENIAPKRFETYTIKWVW